MAAGSWVLDERQSRYGLDRHLAGLLQDLLDCEDRERAVRLCSLVELDVAPPRGGVADDADAVLALLVAHLAVMTPAARPEAVALVTHIADSMRVVGGRWAEEGRRQQAMALPVVAALAQHGDDDLRAELVDLAALCAAADPHVAEEASFYLHRLAEQGGAVGAAAAQEVALLSAHPDARTTVISERASAVGPATAKDEGP